VADLEAVIGAAGIDRMDVVAWSDATPIAVRYAARYPERVAHLVLCSPFPLDSGSAAHESSLQTAAMIRANWSLARRAMASIVFPSGPEELQRWWSQLIKDGTSQEMAARHHAEYRTRIDVREDVKKVEAPTLALTFSGSRQVSLAESRTVAAAIDGARLVQLSGGMSEFYEKFDEIILPFLNDEVGRAAPRTLPGGTNSILFADIADSTALTERLGDAAFRERARDLDGALRMVIRDHDGTPIEGKLLGDGVLATFSSAR